MTSGTDVPGVLLGARGVLANSVIGSWKSDRVAGVGQEGLTRTLRVLVEGGDGSDALWAAESFCELFKGLGETGTGQLDVSQDSAEGGRLVRSESSGKQT